MMALSGGRIRLGAQVGSLAGTSEYGKLASMGCLSGQRRRTTPSRQGLPIITLGGQVHRPPR